MLRKTETYDIVVVGGGLSGFCAAVAAARQGATVCLVQDRPVLGGNSSSEVRVQTRGSATYHSYAREGGILQEIWVQERHANHKDVFENGWANSVWDLTLYDIAMRTPNLTVHLNTSVHAVDVAAGSIQRVVARVANAEVELTLNATVFLDCTGDGIVAAEAGCSFRSGEESFDEFEEPHAPPKASAQTMGSSLHFEVVDTGREVDFTPPEWAVTYDDDEFFYKGGRIPYDLRGGYWWIEIGVPWHTIYENETIRHELTRHTLGIWDWLKNRNPRTRDELRTHALEWIGQVPGKRESRRIMGLHLLTEHDLTAEESQFDEVAYGGWNIDLHTPGGLLAATSEPTAAEGYVQTGKRSSAAYVAPYGIPLRSLIAKDVTNLLMAGRDLSATHVALGSVRVQATCSLMGQAAGTAAAYSVLRGRPVHELPSEVHEIQQQLLRDGCFLPSTVNQDPLDLARRARVTASSEMPLTSAKPGPWKDIGIRQPSALAAEPLAQRRGQWIPHGAGDAALQKVSMLLNNESGAVREVEVALQEVDHIWDYRIDPSRRRASGSVTVPPGESWVEWEVPGGSAEAEAGYLRLDVGPDPEVSWVPAGSVLPGAVSAFEMTPGRMRRFRDGVTMAFQVDPPRHPWQAEQVISGEARPHRSANEWRSDGGEGPQWVELRWEQPERVGAVHLVFPGHLLCESDRYPSTYRDPQTAEAYSVEIEVSGQWQEVVSEEGNFRPRREHEFEPQPIDALRVRVHRANGDPVVGMYEIRCYEETPSWSLKNA